MAVEAAVIGAGRLGSLHASKYAALADVHLGYVVDLDEGRSRAVAAQFGAAALLDYRGLIGKIQLATIATPGIAHHRIARYLLEAGIDVLVEKPMAATLAEAHDLASAAQRYGRILQIGHLERFNPAIVHLRSMLNNPRFIECHRLAPFTERGADVDVVLDLMVHDLDVVLSANEAAPQTVEAVGVAALTERIDVANARIRFSNGLIANLNASRVAPRRERKIRFFQPDAYISVDYEGRTIQVYRRSPPGPGAQFPTISAEQIDLVEGDALQAEVAAFVESVRTRSAPVVGPADGLRVMELSELIRRSIAQDGARLEFDAAVTGGEAPHLDDG